MLVAFCSQGDNIPDAVAMANKLDSWIELKQKYKVIDTLCSVYNLIGATVNLEFFNC